MKERGEGRCPTSGREERWDGESSSSVVVELGSFSVDVMGGGMGEEEEVDVLASARKKGVARGRGRVRTGLEVDTRLCRAALKLTARRKSLNGSGMLGAVPPSCWAREMSATCSSSVRSHRNPLSSSYPSSTSRVPLP